MRCVSSRVFLVSDDLYSAQPPVESNCMPLIIVEVARGLPVVVKRQFYCNVQWRYGTVYLRITVGECVHVCECM